MENLYFYAFAATAIIVVLRGLIKPERFYLYPYFMATTFAVFILPQALSLRNNPGGVPLESIGPVMLATLLCLIASLVGSRIQSLAVAVRVFEVPVSLRRLVHVAVVFVAVGIFFNFLIRGMTYEERGGSMATGKVTIYLFFNQLIYPGLAILLFSAMKKRDVLSWAMVAVASAIPIESIIFAGRREGAALFVLTVALTLYYERRFVPPRIVVAGVIAFAMIAIPATSSYRSAMSDNDVEAVADIDLVGNFKSFVKGDAILELRNAAAVIFSTQLRGTYEFGAAYWDEIIWRFVPAQIVGAEFKNSLMLVPFVPDPKRGPEIVDLGLRDYSMPIGSTVTGMGDSFRQFGYFGCAFFVIIAVLFRSLWLASLQPQAYFAKLLYMLSTTSAMRAVTHQTVDFLPGLLYNLIFLGLAAVYARKPERLNVSAPSSAKPTLPAPPAPKEPAASPKAATFSVLKREEKKPIENLFED